MYHIHHKLEQLYLSLFKPIRVLILNCLIILFFSILNAVFTLSILINFIKFDDVCFN
jgi:hypothetical protein